MILNALSGRPFTHDGEHFRIPETTIFPQPVQNPLADLGDGAEPQSVDATVRRGFNLLTGGAGVPSSRTSSSLTEGATMPCNGVLAGKGAFAL